MSQSFTGGATGNPFADQLLNAIYTVHGVSEVAGLRIERGSLAQGWDGQFDPSTRTATISTNAPYPLSTGAHEIGHALDSLFLVSTSKLGRLDSPLSLYASQYAVDHRGILVDWFDAVLQTRLVAELRQIRQNFLFMSYEWNEVTYLLDPTELWARSYEQFIAINAQNADLQAQFRQKRQEQFQIADRMFGVYWTQEEFEPIEREIKRMLESLGWI